MKFAMTPSEILAAARAPEPGDEGYDPFEAFDHAQGADEVPDPYPVFAELLAECPVHHGSMGARLGKPSVSDLLAGERPIVNVYSYDGVEAVLRDGGTFSSAGYAESMGLVMGHTILEMDEPEHGQYRKLIQQAFTRREMERWEHEIVVPVLNHYLDAFVDRGRADLVGELMFVFPVHVIAIALGLPEADLPAFYRRAVEITNMANEIERGFAASQWLYDYLEPVVEDRRAEPQEDLISLLAHAELDGQRLTNDEIIAFCRLLLPAGAETTYRAASNMMVGLLGDPAQLDAVRADRSLVSAAVEEAIRWEAPLTGISRTATVDTEVEGSAVAAGSLVNTCLGAANRDPDRWDDAERYDIFRSSKPHVGFATGPHLCLGIHLARMEMRAVLECLLDRLPGLRLDPDAELPTIAGLAFRAPATLPVVWDV
ncbi:cytochrome P450 [Candidatus Poriferisocius sp.]|uniref:cytochrome P450 n=1 Tax=Candidatus Poriferisocius sp. TaxID=3101276 RepID=UPI003B59BD9C